MKTSRTKTPRNKESPLGNEERPPPINEERLPPINEERLPPRNKERPPGNEERLPPINEERPPPINEERPPPRNKERPPGNEERPPPINEERPPPINEERPPPGNEQRAPRNVERLPSNEERPPRARTTCTAGTAGMARTSTASGARTKGREEVLQRQQCPSVLPGLEGRKVPLLLPLLTRPSAECQLLQRLFLVPTPVVVPPLVQVEEHQRQRLGPKQLLTAAPLCCRCNSSGRCKCCSCCRRGSQCHSC